MERGRREVGRAAERDAASGAESSQAFLKHGPRRAENAWEEGRRSSWREIEAISSDDGVFLCREIRQSLRSLLKRPGLTATAVLTLALGLGASTAIFSLLDTVALRPLPYRDADRLVEIGTAVPGLKDLRGVSWPQFQALLAASRETTAITAYYTGAFGLTERERPEETPGARVSSGFFDVWGVAPLLGRTFTADEEKPAGGRRGQRWRGCRAALGRLLAATLRRRPGDPRPEPEPRRPAHDRRRRPAGRPALPLRRHPDLAPPSGRRQLRDQEGAGDLGAGYLQVVARLKPGVPLAAAQRDFDRIWRATGRACRTRSTRRSPSPPCRSTSTWWGRPARTLLVLLAAVVPGAPDRLRRRRQPPLGRRPLAAPRDRRPHRPRSRAAAHPRPGAAREPAPRRRGRAPGAALRLPGPEAPGRRPPRRPAADRRGGPLRPRPRLRLPRHGGGRRPRRRRSRLADSAHRSQELPRRARHDRRGRGGAGQGLLVTAADRPRAGALLGRRAPPAEPRAGQRHASSASPRTPAVRAGHPPRRQVPRRRRAAGLLRGAARAPPRLPGVQSAALVEYPPVAGASAHQDDRRGPGAAPPGRAAAGRPPVHRRRLLPDPADALPRRARLRSAGLARRAAATAIVSRSLPRPLLPRREPAGQAPAPAQRPPHRDRRGGGGHPAEPAGRGRRSRRSSSSTPGGHRTVAPQLHEPGHPHGACRSRASRSRCSARSAPSTPASRCRSWRRCIRCSRSPPRGGA